MSTLAKLSRQAVQLEQDRQHEKALALYARLFDEAAAAQEDVDVALFNRAGDLAMRLGDTPRGIAYFERAVDSYAAGGLLNNAIAVCNKLLRHAPDHAATHYTLAVLHAKQGFRGDAKHHYVEYASRMHRGGRDDEALRALVEFAALCPPGDDARAVLAQHLARGKRGTEVSSGLQELLAGASGATTGSPAAASSAPASGTSPAAAHSADVAPAGSLVFLDVSLDGAEPLAPVPGLEFTSVADAAPADVPARLELAPLGGAWSGDAGAEEAPPRAGLDALALDAATMADASLGDAFAAPASRRTALPGELPPLSLHAWLTGAAPAIPPTVDAPTPVALDFLVEEPGLPAFAADASEIVVVEHESPALLAVADLPLIQVDAHVDVAGVFGAPADEAPGAAGRGDFVDLGDWLRSDEPERTTRMTVEDATPTGDEAADFARMLGIFKAGIARNVDATDYASHYDLGVAFREMGLLDEAIGEFQRAARAPDGALRAKEALGQCFLDRDLPELAASTLERALAESAAAAGGAAHDERAVLGLVYLLGEAHVRLGQVEAARACFQRVVATEIEFRDAARRLTQLPAQTP